MEGGGEEILEPYQLGYSDLMLLSSSFSLEPEEMERMQSVTRKIMENLGPTGPGLIAVTGVPGGSTLRQYLLPLARKLALLNNEDRKRLLKEHSLGSDVPLKNLDRSVSSFAMQLKYVDCLDVAHDDASYIGVNGHTEYVRYPDVEMLEKFQDKDFKNLGDKFKELGFCMMEIGRRLARICDRCIGGQELEQSLLESGTAKGRLIHYHSTMDKIILKEAATRKGSTEKSSNYKSFHDQSKLRGLETKLSGNQSNLWQQWHYDYGIFTVLTAPMFMLPCFSQKTREDDCSCLSCGEECPSPTGHTYLKIFHPNKQRVLVVKASPESFIVQVGESADILSKGKLRSTLHAVCRPQELESLSRENFVVFLQPAWSKTLSLLDYAIEHSVSTDQHSGECADESHSTKQELSKLPQEIYKIVPPLSARLKDGMTFAEFSRETTKQYYGGSGLQSKR
ncbi:hypothetical protein RJ640_019710 [Escallonia rubra]|uniref:Isopenicillin N synthase-like Fe(2+) 2OG dioxygenase domain-containing protein n=1 Tax=Escallonia rubra TaxID=112253 RepID=A0AA88UJC2_9ASTE|nr:hypothetical protein RJ640_019710 [Escallonia rubra]